MTHLPRGAALLAVVALAGCAVPRSGQVVEVAPYVPEQFAPPSGRAVVALAPFTDLPATGFEGAGATGRTVLRFRVAPSPGRVAQQAVGAELQAAGERITAGDAPVVVSGAVQRFAVTATDTGLYWSTVVDIALAVTARRGGRELSHSYSQRCQDVAYVPPGPQAMAPQVARCVAQVVQQFGRDREMARMIGD